VSYSWTLFFYFIQHMSIYLLCIFIFKCSFFYSFYQNRIDVFIFLNKISKQSDFHTSFVYCFPHFAWFFLVQTGYIYHYSLSYFPKCHWWTNIKTNYFVPISWRVPLCPWRNGVELVVVVLWLLCSHPSLASEPHFSFLFFHSPQNMV